MTKTILITGVDGRIGGKLTKWLLDKTDFNILGVGIDRKLFDGMLEREGIPMSDRLNYLTSETFMETPADTLDIYGAVHLAFSRRLCPPEDIASSINFASAVFEKLSHSPVQRVINLSSQGIYGNVADFRSESTPPAPTNHYTMAKYAAEVIFETHFRNTAKDYANLRLDPVVQSQNLVVALCRQAKQGRIELRGGEQRFSFIDLSDVDSAIGSMLESPSGWERVYNVGWNKRRYTLVEIADAVSDVADILGHGRPVIHLEKEDISLWAGMVSEKFMAHTGWKPTVDLKGMIKNIFKDAEA